MSFNELMFRNVEGSSADPVRTWHPEVIASILAYGGADDYAPVMNEIFADPWGPVARTVEEIVRHLDLDDEDESVDSGTAALFAAGLRYAREDAEAEEQSAVADELAQLVRRSGLRQTEFAARLGTSAGRLSNYLRAKISPRASLMVRARRVAADAESSTGAPGRQPGFRKPGLRKE